MEPCSMYSKDGFKISSHNKVYIFANKPLEITFYIALGTLMCGSLLNFVA